MAKTRQTARERSEPYRLIYLVLGERRSPAAVLETAASMGVRNPPSEKTIARWRGDFGWVKDAEEYDARRRAEHTEVLLEDQFAIDRRHAQVGRTLQQLALQGVNRLAPEQGGIRVLSSDVRPGDVARLAQAGVQIERLATGLATDRVEVLTQVWNAITVQVVELFLQVNVIEDPNARALRFGQGVDAIVAQQLAPATRRRIEAGPAD